MLNPLFFALTWLWRDTQEFSVSCTNQIQNVYQLSKSHAHNWLNIQTGTISINMQDTTR